MDANKLDTTDIKIREAVRFDQDRKFNTRVLPADMQRVFKSLKKEYGEDYALCVVFAIRTAIGLHRAWHMTLLTSKILQQLKERFRLRMTWNLGVFRLSFSMSEGEEELFRRVPYDYDSEHQDTFVRTAIALMDNEITVHEALIYQWETEQGIHTAKSGLFLRDFPGRLVLYPVLASTCAVIFFGGDWKDFGIAALCGLATGVVEQILGYFGFGILTDTFVGVTTGLIGGLFYRFGNEDVCLQSVFLGTLYWYFYGTAFVLGILEIIGGELETGVTRFIAVSVKTFVLCLGAGFGMMAVGNATDVWFEQQANCDAGSGIDLTVVWWRVPLYLLCSVAVLGQYRFPVVRYWRALVTMLVGYEVQYRTQNFFFGINQKDALDTAISNVFGCAAAVISACIVSYWLNKFQYLYDIRILNPDHPDANKRLGKTVRQFMHLLVKLELLLGLAHSNDKDRLEMEKKLRREWKKDASQRDIILNEKEHNILVDTIIGTQDMNIWSIMMPALYQLVPGSMIAKLWFGYIFPPKLEETIVEIPETNFNITYYNMNEQDNNVFGGLMVVSTSLALGLMIGFAFVEIFEDIVAAFGCLKPPKHLTPSKLRRAKDRRTGMYSSPVEKENNPASVAAELKKAILSGLKTASQADDVFHAIDVDRSGTLDEEEVAFYMLGAGLSQEQIRGLFGKMDKDQDGEVSREEFRKVIMDVENKALLTPADKKAVQESPSIPIPMAETAVALNIGSYASA